ncbi:MAG: MBL fold metallo-hydrolase [Planctomycetota bacterium]
MLPRLYAAGWLIAAAAAQATSPTVQVLVEGYVAPIEGREFVPGVAPDGARKVASTVVLVQAGDVTLVADPGMVADRALIADGLAECGVKPEDVTHVFISHHHPDHTVNIGMFPRAKVIDFGGVVENDVWSDHPDPYTITEGVYVMRTPGHTDEDASLVVETFDGTVVLTHVWWNDQMQPAIDPLAADQQTLEASRQKVLEIADWIIPGHGKKFRAPGR